MSTGHHPPNVYLASPDPRSGKSAVAAGLLEEKKRQFARVGVFRPIVRSDGVRDHILAMLLEHLDGSLDYAEVFARAGYEVTVVARTPERAAGALSTIEASLDRQVDKGRLDAADRDNAERRRSGCDRATRRWCPGVPRWRVRPVVECSDETVESVDDE